MMPPDWVANDDVDDREPATRSRIPSHSPPEGVSICVQATPHQRPRRDRPAERLPLPPPEIERSRSASKSASKSVSKSASVSKSKSKSRSAPAPAPAAAPAPAPVPAAVAAPAPVPPAPPAVAAAAEPAPAIQQLPGGLGAIDPLQIPLPPELAPPIFGWIRRLALQADLAGADRVLRDALSDMTSSLSVAIIYPGPEGLWTMGDDEEVPRDPQPLVAVGRSRRAVIASHTALIPILTASEVIAIAILTRNPRNPAYHPMEQIAAISLARESAAILHHLAGQHLQSQAEIKADAGGLYRGEALEAHRSRGTEGVPVNLSPTWVRRTYPILVAAILIGVVAAIVIKVPTYSSGHGFVKFDGEPVRTTVQGTVERLHVQKGQLVRKGDLLATLSSAEMLSNLEQTTRDYESLLLQYLSDNADDQSRKALATAESAKNRAEQAVEQRRLYAPADGTISDIRIELNKMINPGEELLSIVAPGTDPEIVAFLPGRDRPRLRLGMLMQVELVGFTKARENIKITSIASDAISGDEIQRLILGPAQAGAFRQLSGANWVIVRGKLDRSTFRAENETNRYHHGLQTKVEVKTKDKPFLVTLLPAIEKYVP